MNASAEKGLRKVNQDRPIDVKVIFAEGCENTPPTIKAIEKVAAELDVAIELRQVLVRTQAEARANRFLGSPTVQINGLDLDPAQRNNRNYGFT